MNSKSGKPISSWGRLMSPHHEVKSLYSPADFMQQEIKSVIYGMGRSYGDVCLNPQGILWQTQHLNHFIHFDENTGVLSCESGVLLKDIQDLFLPRGWMLPVTPGTQFVTVGGAIANDIHGKNHHSMGSFGHHVKSIHLVRTTGEKIFCSPQENAEWFSATVGGLGLTGLITEASIQLKPVASSWMERQIYSFQNIQEFFTLSEALENKREYTVSWVDCLSKNAGRGIFIAADHRHGEDSIMKKSHVKKVPFVPPFSFVNRYSVTLLNNLYFHVNKTKTEKACVSYERFLYPLDNILHWNKLYGPRGFYQYQCWIPKNAAPDVLQKLIQEIKKSEEGSFLSVLKTFGEKESLGLLSFPKSGVTFALDFQNRGRSTLKLLDKLDGILREVNGRLYLAKDARMSREFFEESYENFNAFSSYRDPGLCSGLSKRLMGE